MAEVYISSTGDDTSGNGTVNNPWATVAKAHANTAAGDTIWLKDMISVGSWQFTGNRIYRGVLSASGKVVAGVDHQGNNFVNRPISNGIICQDIIIKNINSVAKAVINGNNSGQIRTVSTGTYTFENVVFDNIYVGNSSNRAGDRGAFFYCYSGSGGLDSFIFDRCTIKNIGLANGSNKQFFISAYVFDYQTVWKNCTIDLTPPTGTAGPSHFIARLAANTSLTHTMRNCIVYSGANNTIELIDSTMTDDINYADNLVQSSFSSVNIGNCLTGDPLFINPSQGDYNLRPSSPCLNAGVII